MLNDIKSAFARTAPTLLQDAVGAAALIVMMAVALHLPGLL